METQESPSSQKNWWKAVLIALLIGLLWAIGDNLIRLLTGFKEPVTGSSAYWLYNLPAFLAGYILRWWTH